MTGAISAAIPLKLFRYSDVTTRVDSELVSESNYLAGKLHHFEAACTEYPVHVSYLADHLRSYAREADQIDRWVRDVGVGFQRADHSRLLEWLQYRRLRDELRAVGPTLIRGMEWLQTLQLGVAGSLIVASIKAGPTAAQITIDLPDALRHIPFVKLRKIREWASFSGYVNNIGWQNIPGHVLKYGLKFSVIVIVIKWGVDIFTYEGTELASAMTVDAVLTLVPVVVSYVAMKVLALVLAGAVAAGTVSAVVAGFAIIVVGVAAGIAIGLTIDHFEIRDKAIPWVDEHIFQPIARTIARGVDALSDFVDGAARRLREQFDEVNRAAQLRVSKLRRDMARGVSDVLHAIGDAALDVGKEAKRRFERSLDSGAALTREIGRRLENLGEGLRHSLDQRLSDSVLNSLLMSSPVAIATRFMQSDVGIRLQLATDGIVLQEIQSTDTELQSEGPPPRIYLINGINQEPGQPSQTMVDLQGLLVEHGYDEAEIRRLGTVYADIPEHSETAEFFDKMMGLPVGTWVHAAFRTTYNVEQVLEEHVLEEGSTETSRAQQLAHRHLLNHPLMEGQKIIIVGHSGGGAIAPNVAEYIERDLEYLGYDVEGIVTLGSPLVDADQASEYAEKTVAVHARSDVCGWPQLLPEIRGDITLGSTTLGILGVADLKVPQATMEVEIEDVIVNRVIGDWDWNFLRAHGSYAYSDDLITILREEFPSLAQSLDAPDVPSSPQPEPVPTPSPMQVPRAHQAQVGN